MTHEASAPPRSSAILIGVGSLLTAAAMTHHPSAHGATAAERVESIAHMAERSAWVHGALIALMVAVWIGTLGLSRALGWSSERVRAAAALYSLGVVAMTGAALVSGFLGPGLAGRAVEGAADELDAWLRLLSAAHDVNQVLARLGTLAFSLAIAAWSAVLVARRGLARAAGGLGLALGLATVAALLGGPLRLDVRGMSLVVFGQTAWALLVAAWMLRAAAESARRRYAA